MKKIAILTASIFVVFSGYFVSPVSFVHAQTTTPSALSVNTGIENAVDQNCSGLSNPFSANCLLYAFYNVILQPSFGLVGLVAQLLDFFLGYSLDSNAYRSDFIVKGWGLIRDISNIAFIFTLLYLAIKHILGSSSKKYIPTLIIVALLLNFSLFFTKVVIDAGNILARAFYNSIVIENDTTYEDVEGYKSITYGIVDKINPQNLLSTALFESGAGGQIGSIDQTTGQFQGTVTPDISGNTGTIFLIFILMTVVNLVLAWTFLSVSLTFIGRVIGLWFAMIFSPIAFITLAVPGSGGFFKQLSFDSWKDNVIKLAFLAPVFIFFLYLTISFLSILGTGESLAPAEGSSMFVALMKVFIPFLFIITLLQVAKKTADSMAGEFGGMVKSFVGKALGFVGGAALGATAFVGRATVGRFAGGALETGNYEKRIADAKGLNKWQLMVQRSALKKVNESSLDIRNASKAKGLAGKISGVVGTGLGYGMTGFGGKDFNAGKGSDQSRKKYEESAEKRRVELAKELGTVRSGEKDTLVKQRQGEITKEINALEENRNAVESGFKTNTETISKRLEELGKKSKAGFGAMSQRERDEEVTLKADLEKAKKEKDEKISEIDNDIKKKKELNNKDAIVKDETKRRQFEYAREVEDGWIKGVFNPYDLATGNAKQTAEKIRGLSKEKSKKEKAAEAALAFVKEEQESESKEKDEKPKEEKKDEKPKEEKKDEGGK